MTRIVLIHSQPTERDRLALALHRAQHSVRSAGDAQAGLQLVLEWRPDVIVTEDSLCDAAGEKVIDVLRNLPAVRHAGIISLLAPSPPGSSSPPDSSSPPGSSVPPSTPDLRSALLAGADDALVQPVPEEVLLGAVRARERRAATLPAPPEAPDAALESLTTALARCSRPATVALVQLQDAHALAAVANPETFREFTALWRARIHALACDAGGTFTLSPSEVVVLLLPSTPHLRALLAALAGTGQAPLAVGGTEYRARAAIGTTDVPAAKESPSAAAVLRQCRFALQRADGSSHPQVHAYDSAEAHAALDDLILATHIHRAAEEGRFKLAWQPVVAIPSGQVTSVEALIRWHMPTGEWISPDRILAVADRVGLVDEVGTWALREACRQAARWTQSGLRTTVRVNIARGQFQRGDFVDEARMALSECGLQGDQLTVEVSEGALARDGGAIRDQLADVRVSGVRVAVEDVGAGALALPTLRSLPLDELKIDRSLVAMLPGNAQDRAAADLVLREASDLRVPCIAEGVENAAQWAYLSERGWTAAQGFLISHPLPPEALPDFVRRAEERTMLAT